MNDRAPISSIGSMVIAKEPLRKQIAADLARFLQKRGQRIEVLPPGASSQSNQTYLERRDAMSRAEADRKAQRQKRSQAADSAFDEAEDDADLDE